MKKLYPLSTPAIPARLVLMVVLLCVPALLPSACGQSIDLEHAADGFQKKNLLKLSGFVSANGIYSISSNPENQRLPFTYFLNGGVNARLFGLIDMPVQFSLTNVGGQFNYPTLPTRLSIHPSYKWATAHIGNTAMTFSPYTLNGHLFDGVGLELQPGRIRVAAMYGRLQRGQNFDSANAASPAAYRRIGWGAKLGYVTDGWSIAYTVFRAKDDAGSISLLPPDSLAIYPQENLAMALEGTLHLSKKLDLMAEYATSGITANTSSDAKTETSKDGFQALDPFMKRRVSSEYHNALRSTLNYRFSKTIVGLGYERVDPGYKTLGAYYFNNDLESTTLNLTQQAFKDRMTIALTGGYQHDNLEQLKGATNHRGAGAVNVSYFASESFNVAASYSNFLTYINVQSQFQRINQVNPYQYVDTLNFQQVSENAMVSVNKIVSKSDVRIHALNISGSFLKARDKKGEVVNDEGASTFYNGAATWSTQQLPRRITTSLGLNASLNRVGVNNFITAGPTLALAWNVLKDKLFAGLGLSYNRSSGPSMGSTSVLNSRLYANYTLTKTQRISFGLMGQQRNTPQGSPSDWVINLGYDFRF